MGRSHHVRGEPTGNQAAHQGETKTTEGFRLNACHSQRTWWNPALMAEAYEHLCHGRVGAREGYWLTLKELILGNTQQPPFPHKRTVFLYSVLKAGGMKNRRCRRLEARYTGERKERLMLWVCFFFSLVVRLSGSSAPEMEILFPSFLLLTSFQEQLISQPLASV